MTTELNEKKSVRLILHPGHGKCGSSSIQSFIYSNVAQLEAQKIYVSDANFRFSFETEKSSLIWKFPLLYFRDLIDGRKDITVFEQRLKTIINEAKKSDCEAIIISSENLIGLDWGNGSCQKIHKILSQYFSDITVIYYIRRQEDYLISAWQQWRYQGGEKLKDSIFHFLNIHRPDFLVTAKFFEDVYGANSLQVIPLNKEALVGGKLITDFCHRAGINIENNVDYYSNPSLNPYLCDILARIPNIFLYHLNDYFPKHTHENYEIQRILHKNLSSKDLFWSNDKTILDDETKEAIMKHFEKDNRELHQAYFDYIPYEKVFGLEKSANSQNLEYQLDKLKDVVAIQMEIILKLLIEKEEQEKNNFQRKLKDKIKKIFKRMKKKLNFS
ncbi:hypothetical protein PCC7424_4426 [Gloeothece citriformis PCC 7424]|uniref:Uncharacterized protein n=1 Tax=Gloeothece citriformis (strain PCC 7424) TaxID=65393 RepID=B7K921_GLOC7|nr:hypothetical protein [Gloeothece citriformis]ACK72790.1 hypothetical protein PCC7424_4426 [Gloeothece citriformis PCC 7424]